MRKQNVVRRVGYFVPKSLIAGARIVEQSKADKNLRLVEREPILYAVAQLRSNDVDVVFEILGDMKVTGRAR